MTSVPLSTRKSNVGEFRTRQTFDRYLRWSPDLSEELVEQIWADPQALLASGHMLQDKPRTTVVRLDHACGTFVWKSHNWGSIYRSVKKSLARTTARKAWCDAQYLCKGGVPTPRPRAVFEWRVGPFRASSFVLTDYVPGTSLYRLMRFEQPSRDMVHDLARQVADIWQRLDELGVWHNDFKTENLLVDPQGKVWLIDLERTRICRNRDQMRRRQARDAGDLLHPRNWRSDPAAAEIFRSEILRTPAAKATLADKEAAKHPLQREVPPRNRPSQLVTVMIPCRNASETIVGCIESVRDMADEILVADAGSNDDTVQLARLVGGCRIIEQPITDGVAFETWAQAHARHPWILRLLPDEELNSELGRQVQDTLAREPGEHGFRVGRLLTYHGERLNHGAKHESVRLYRKNAVHYEMRGNRVEACVAEDKIGKLKSRLTCETCPSIEQLLEEALRIAKAAASDDLLHGRLPNRWGVVWRAPWEFVRSYFLGAGWLDGWAGVHASSTAALTIYLRQSLLWQMQRPIVAAHKMRIEDHTSLRIFDPQRLAEFGEEGTAGVASYDGRCVESPETLVPEVPKLRTAA